MAGSQVNNLTYSEGKKHDVKSIKVGVKVKVDKEPCYLSLSKDGLSLRDNRTRLSDDFCISYSLLKVGHKHARNKMIGATGCRNQFMNDIHDNAIDVNSEHLLNCIMDNAPEVRKRHARLLSREESNMEETHCLKVQILML